MRKTAKAGSLTVQLIAGSYVVLIGMNLPKNKTAKFLGFAIQRTDLQNSEVIWMRGMKTFEETDPADGIGQSFSSREHPFQTFQWADYSVKPQCTYKYKIIALRGKPTVLEEDETVSITITTESEINNTHAVFFNRGAAASQEYARRFLNKKPSEIGSPAYNWLSRGLAEAMLDFISKAKNGTFTLLGAVYEFELPAILKALKEASNKGAQVTILYHAFDDVTKKENEKAIQEAGIKGICKRRKNTLKLAHNKFFILLQNNKPIEIWTGSTNISENGIYGHSNVGHIVRDAAIAKTYHNYWLKLNEDADGAAIKNWLEETNPLPKPTDPFPETLPVFSPHKGLGFLKWYSELAGLAKEALFMTFAFGMNNEFLNVYDNRDSVLRIALMDKKGANDEAEREIDRVRRLPNCIVAVGNNIKVNAFDQ
ncbi:MAG TPA: phospholipase D-like domain-containing protein [Chitinophagaceae bacterium]|nr:phospholipase D-like domain-containing protein [Chitinophagaceae bacterium]